MNSVKKTKKNDLDTINNEHDLETNNKGNLILR